MITTEELIDNISLTMSFTFIIKSGHFNFVQSGHYHVAVTPIDS